MVLFWISNDSDSSTDCLQQILVIGDSIFNINIVPLHLGTKNYKNSKQVRKDMSNWFECKVRYDKLQENGAAKKVNEPYLVDALSFTEAEARITEEQTPFISGEFTVSAIKSTKIAEIFWDETGDRWYLVKVAFITIDEKTAAEKRSISQILVQAANFRHALERFEEGMKGTMADYEIVSINETPIMDVYKMKVVE